MNDGYILLHQGQYIKAIEAFEHAIELEPTQLSNYCYLGLAYLLQHEEETAQLIWLGAISDNETNSTENIIDELVQILSEEADHLANVEQFQHAWAVRCHIREFDTQNLFNLLSLVDLSIKLGEFTEDFLEDSGLVNLLGTSNALDTVEFLALEKIFEDVLNFPFSIVLRFSEACLPHFPSISQWSGYMISATTTLAYGQKRLIFFAIALVELCIQYDPDNTAALGCLPRLLIECHRFSDAIEAARIFYERFSNPEIRFFSTCILLQALMRAGNWNEIPKISEELRALILELIYNQSTQLSLSTIQFLILNTSFFAYLHDDLERNRLLQNQASQLFLKNILNNTVSLKKNSVSINLFKKTKIRVGYIASTLRLHSVGWLSRWLFKHHNKEDFELYLYMVQQSPDDTFTKTWFLPNVNHYKFLSEGIFNATKTIFEDDLDILVDLDSTTNDFTCTVMALKPAPIQVTWLGNDASGLPTVDYFLADPYVLSDKAQDYYHEKIWRLPQTYIAVDGFEIGHPTLRRSDLEIPETAIIYWSSQVGYKRNPEIVRLQMKIIKEVQDSYFLIKGLGDQDIISDFFVRIAEEEEVACDRLRFLPIMKDEYTHRANLQIADVALDTYPYNGATTTLETLWAGVPLVTRVGSTFSSRNSYAFMTNAGITEGIAWTDEEYVEWGIRLGKDEQLRKQVSWKLKQSRHTSPLWNAKQFTRDMENAYREMWAIHAAK